MDPVTPTEQTTAPASAPASAAPPVASASPDRAKAAAEKAKQRRMLKKLKEAKSNDEMIRMLTGATSEEPEEKRTKKAAAPAEELEPGQKKGWPKPSEIASFEGALKSVFALAGSGAGAAVAIMDGAGQLKTQEERLLAVAVSTGIQKSLEGSAGDKLAEAWAPIAAKYLPDFFTSPWFPAVIGTAAAGNEIRKAINEEMNRAVDEIERRQRAAQEPASA